MTHNYALIENLRQKGFRITLQRESIIDAVAHSEHHVSADNILEIVQQHSPEINLATVYRTLEILTAQGLVSRLDLGDDCVVYATTQHGPHIHLVCRLCGRVIDADQQLITSLGQQLAEQYCFQADLLHVSILGVCVNCRPKVRSDQLGG
jgi:Fur family ferric uptake transcriptional regulator